MDSRALGEFLRSRRCALQPEDVGLPRRARRRTEGLRREEVAELSAMSTDYYARLERGSGLQPSEQMVAAIARGLRLSLAERDHIFVLAGHRTPPPLLRSEHVSPGLMRILDRLHDTPAQVMGGLGETLAQTDLARALLGEQTQYTGRERSAVYRWFTDPASRGVYLPEDYQMHGRVYAAQLRQSATAHGPGSAAADLAAHLSAVSEEFRTLWGEQEIGLTYTETKRFSHPSVGEMDLLRRDRGRCRSGHCGRPGGGAGRDRHLLVAVAARQAGRALGGEYCHLRGRHDVAAVGTDERAAAGRLGPAGCL